MIKSLLPIALIAGTGLGVFAQTMTGTVPVKPPTPSMVVPIPAGGDKDCLADYIVRQCLQSENDKLAACAVTDYQCICYASQAIATCYNNCPNDSRAPFATQSMNAACALAAQYAPKTSSRTSLPHTTSAGPAAQTTTPSSGGGPNPTDAATGVSFVSGGGAGASTANGAAAAVGLGDAAGWVAAVAGVVAAAL
ncbi:hypothetical protein E4U41_004533 [Claviceps citrina]|nr:hypothetical protein E4U41_004533 [Claviceps citrina]